jgi:hypothetical protein
LWGSINKRTATVLVVGLTRFLFRCSVVPAEIDYTYDQDTVFAHSATASYWLSGQVNSIFQWHQRFGAEYSGPNIFEHASEQADSVVATLYSGLQLSPNTELLVDLESAGVVDLVRP